MHAPGGTLFGYPKGIFLLSFTEFWERFSYYGMLSLLVMFLTTAVDQGGFGWDEPKSLKLYGFYTGVIYIVPIFGGWLANRYWGERPCIVAGGLLLTLGHFLLAGPAVVPWLASQITTVDYHRIWIDAGIPLGAVILTLTERDALTSLASSLDIPAIQILPVYYFTSASFFSGIGLIISGTALIKPTISSIIGDFFSSNDPRRDGAFSIFYVCIYLGSLSASFFIGFLGERIAWHWGFTCAGFGMVIGVIAFLYKQKKYIGKIGTEPKGKTNNLTENLKLTNNDKDHITVILIQGLFTIVYAAAFFQKGGLLTLYAKDDIQRYLGGWEIPVTWFLLISTATFVLVTPVAARVWNQLAMTNLNPNASSKLAMGIISLGIGYLFLVLGTPSNGDKADWIWLVITYIFFGIGDALVWPIQISQITRLAPKHLTSFFIGAWYVTVGLGSWLTGYIAMLAYHWEILDVFKLLCFSTFCIGCLLLIMTPRLQRRVHISDNA